MKFILRNHLFFLWYRFSSEVVFQILYPLSFYLYIFVPGATKKSHWIFKAWRGGVHRRKNLNYLVRNKSPADGDNDTCQKKVWKKLILFPSTYMLIQISLKFKGCQGGHCILIFAVVPLQCFLWCYSFIQKCPLRDLNTQSKTAGPNYMALLAMSKE